MPQPGRLILKLDKTSNSGDQEGQTEEPRIGSIDRDRRRRFRLRGPVYRPARHHQDRRIAARPDPGDHHLRASAHLRRVPNAEIIGNIRGTFYEPAPDRADGGQ